MDKKFINGIFLTRNVPRVGIPLDIFTRKNRMDTYLLKKTIDVVNVNPLTEDIYEIETQQEVYTVVFAETTNMRCVRDINSTAYKEIKKNLNL